MTSFGDIVSGAGIPLLGNLGINIPSGNGKILFVNPNGPAGFGESPSAALGTIQAAINGCNDGMGDTIVVYPGTYVENLVINKSKITIIPAINTGNAKRVVVAPASGIALDLQTGALSSCIGGLRLVGTGDVGCKLGADGFRAINCDYTSDTTHGLSFVGRAADLSNTGSGASLERCLFRECGGAGINNGFADGASVFATNVNIIGCQFYLNAGADIADQAEGGSQTYWHEWNIVGNQFMTSSPAVYLAMNGGDTGDATLISGNYFNVSVLTSSLIALGANMGFAGNYDQTGVVDQSGL